MIDLARYVGAGFGTGPGQFTCWALVRAVYADCLGVELPTYGDASAAYVSAMAQLRRREITWQEAQAARLAMAREIEAGQGAECWEAVRVPRALDVVLMQHAGTGRIGHVGIAVDARRLLHVESATGAVVVPMGHPTVAGRIRGFRRFVASATL